MDFVSYTRAKLLVMEHKKGINRDQLQMISLDQLVEKESWARIVDLFVSILPIEGLGFKTQLNKEGHPPYHPSDLLKLLLYGYRHGIRSSRKLEHASHVNVEVMWLLKGLRPSNRTIAYFRKQNSDPIKHSFRYFISLLKDQELIEGKTIAIDSFKIRAQNSLKNNYNEKKIKRHLKYIDNHVNDYLEQIEDQADENEKQKLLDKIDRQKEKRKKYEYYENELKNKGLKQISTTDKDAKGVVLHRNIVNVGYNIQASADGLHSLLVDSETGQVNDTHSLAEMAIRCKNMLGLKKLNVLADKGYTTGQELQKCKEENITTYSAPKESSSNKNGKFSMEEFEYDEVQDTYCCPNGSFLTTNGNYYNKGHNKIKRYATKACEQCPIRDECTTNQRGRFIERSIYQTAIEENKERVKSNPAYYRERQHIIEHQFGVLKRQWGFTHTIMKGKQHVLTEVHLLFICYNLMRVVSILGIRDLKSLLKKALIVILELRSYMKNPIVHL